MDELALRLKDLSQTASIVDWRSLVTLSLQLVIILYAIFWTWTRIRGTQAERLVKGIMMLTSICLLSWVLRLTLITSILQQMIPIAVVSLFIIFQPEIRRGLGHLGRTSFRLDMSLGNHQKERMTQVIEEIIAAVHELSRERTGALLVIEPAEGERDYLSPGTPINGLVSANLLVSIFQPKSPLHDGAVVIRADALLAAGVILPITDNPKLNYRYGTRHRAAIGLSEIYDGLCIVVSEETGAISAANRGMLVRYDSAEELREPLAYFYIDDGVEESLLQSFLSLFSKKKSATTAGAVAKGATTPSTPKTAVAPSIKDETSEPPFIEDVRQAEPQPE